MDHHDETHSTDVAIAIEHCLNESAANDFGIATAATSSQRADYASQHSSPYGKESPSDAPVPRMARLLRDGRGKFIYIGDSASLSFLQNVRRIALNVVGECDLTSDRLRHSFLEQPPSSADQPFNAFPDGHSNGHPSFEDAVLALNLNQVEMLANQYLTATAGLLDLFDNSILLQSLQAWVTGQTSKNALSPSILHLVMAIGAQAKAENDWDNAAVHHFARGRELAFHIYTEEPCLQTAQAFILIAMYMLVGTRRNAAFMNLGIAVRAAYALGLHRADIQTLFSESERKSRERIWQSLRVLDLYLSTTLGRPSATSDFEKDPSAGIPYRDNDLSTDDAKFSSAVLRLCSIFERILTEVYKKRMVSTDVADDITREYRQWSQRLPPLPVHLANGPTDAVQAEMAKHVACAHLIGAYHWSIVLLTRPFLVFHVSLHQQKKNGHDDPVLFKDAASASSVATYAECSIDSAIRGLDIAMDLIDSPGLPKRLPFVVNSVFNSALVIGAAFFGDLDRSYPLVDGMAKAERFLAYMSIWEAQARRYAQIVGFLSAMAKEYVHRRDRSSMQSRRQKKNDLFGIVGMQPPHPSQSPVSSRDDTSPRDFVPSNSHAPYRWNPTAPAASALQSTAPFTIASLNQHHELRNDDGDSNHDNNDVNAVLTPPGSRGPDDIFPSILFDQPTLTTSGFLLSRTGTMTPLAGSGAGAAGGGGHGHSNSGSGSGSRRVGQADLHHDTNNMLTAPDYQNGYVVLQSEFVTYAEMLPMFDLFSEPTLCGYYPR